MKRKTLLILAVLLTAIACLFTSCSASVEPPKEEEGLAYVTFGNGGSRSLTTEYGIKSYDDLYWYYTAVKQDGFGLTGQKTDQTRINETKGLSGTVGPLSQGAWVFTLYAYEGVNGNTGNNLVYQGTSATIVLKGGETKAVPVSVSLQGDTGKINLSRAYFQWANNSTATGNIYVTVKLTNANGDLNPTILGPLSKTNNNGYQFGSTYLTVNGLTDISADYYTCTINAYLADDVFNSNVNPGATPVATQVMGLRVYGNATTYITGNLTEGIFANVVFDVAEQDMKVFVPLENGSAEITGISVTPSGESDKTTSVVFSEGALSGIQDNATLQLDVKVTPVESANEKFSIAGVDSSNRSAFAGIDITLMQTTANGQSVAVDSFNNDSDTTARITTYIASGLNNVSVVYNGTDGKAQPKCNDGTDTSKQSNAADVYTADSDMGDKLGYSKESGKLVFETSHFSEYYVLADCVALNVTTNTAYATLGDAISNVDRDETIRLYADCSYSTNGTGLWNIIKSITLDGNGYSISGWGNRVGNNTTLAINNGGSGPISVAIKNITINNAASYGRAIETRGNINSLTLDNVTINLTGVENTQGLTIGGSQNTRPNITIKNSTIDAGTSGYSYISFNPANVSIENSTFKGYSSMYFKGRVSSAGSRGTVVNATDSAFNSPNLHSGSGSNDFGAFTFEDDGISINLSNCKINAENKNTAYQAVFSFYSAASRKDVPVTITIAGNQTKVNGVISMDGTDQWNGSITLKDGTYNLINGGHSDGFNYSSNSKIGLTVTGGTFSTDPLKYVPFGYDVEQVDGKYVVSTSTELIVNNDDQLMKFAASVNAGNDYAGKTITLKSDIDLTGKTWVPIGNAGNPFRGTFNGDNHKISNLTLTSTSDCVGLFGFIDGGIVENIEIQSVSITNDSDDTGAAVGRIINGGKVSYVNVLSGSITGNKRTGGVVGTIKAYGTIENCTNAASVTSNTYNAGGIVGAAYYTKTGEVMNITTCTNTGAVISNGNCAGGIVGLSAANVTGCTNSAKIKGSGTSIGGIVGEQKTYGSVTNNTNTGSVENTKNGNYGNGGIIGWLRYHGTSEASSYAVSDIISVTGNTNSGSVSGGNDAGGIVGTVYNSAVVTGNKNNSTSLSGTTFAAGIVGNYQITETPAASEPASNQLTFKDNTSSTAMENISASNKHLEIYTNGNSIIQ